MEYKVISNWSGQEALSKEMTLLAQEGWRLAKVAATERTMFVVMQRGGSNDLLTEA